MTSAAEIVVCADRAALYERAAHRVVQSAGTAIAARGRFAIALSGGSTPGPLYERLAGPPHRDAIDWGAARVFWADERCVPPTDAESNYRLAAELLLDRVPVPRARAHRMRGEDPEPDRAAARYERELRRSLAATPTAIPRLDLVLLGLGTDGHTASLFPESRALAERERLVVAVRASEPRLRPPIVERLTLTLPAINAARDVVFLVAGESKAAAVAAVLEGPHEPSLWPAQGVAPAGRAVWLLDTAAAARLADLGHADGADESARREAR